MVAFLPSSRPAWASRNAPLHTDITCSAPAADFRIQPTFLDGHRDELVIQPLDALLHPVAKIVPGPPRRLVSTAEPLDGLVEPGFLMPLCGRVDFLELHVQHHLQHDHRIVSFFARPAIRFVQRLGIKLCDLPLDDSCEIIGFQFVIDFSPPWMTRRHGERLELCFLTYWFRLHS